MGELYFQAGLVSSIRRSERLRDLIIEPDGTIKRVSDKTCLKAIAGFSEFIAGKLDILFIAFPRDMIRSVLSPLSF